MEVTVRPAEGKDVGEICRLVIELAQVWIEDPQITPAFCEKYLAAPGCGVLLAEGEGKALGLISYTVRLNLFHAAETALIEEFIVTDEARGKGVGHVLLEAFMAAMQVRGCAEVSVSAMPDNDDALRFYRNHGLTDEAVFLEKHFED